MRYNPTPYNPVPPASPRDYGWYNDKPRAMISIPRGYEIESGQDVEAELLRPDGIIRLTRRPFLSRLRNHYRAYLHPDFGFSRWQALCEAWKLARL